MRHDVVLENFTLYNNAWIIKSGLTTSNPINSVQANLLLNKGGWYLRNIYNWDKTEPSHFWYVIKDGFGGIEELPTKARNQVRKSLKTYYFKIVSYDEMVKVGCDLFNKSRERFGESQRFTQEKWIERLNRDKNNEYWIGYDIATGLPVSFALNAVYDEYVDYCTMGISPDVPNNTYPMYGLIYEMTRYYLEERKVGFVCDGARSITGHSNIQQVLEDKFKFRKAYCDIQVFYKPIIGLAVKILFPLRNMIKPPKVNALLRQEAWTRGLEG